MGIFFDYIADDSVQLVGVEAAGEGLDSGHHAASLQRGKPGVLHGNRTYLLQDADGQVKKRRKRYFQSSAGLLQPPAKKKK